jgi:hypothetical protein
MHLVNNYVEAHCMNCRKEWDRKILTTYFPSCFVNKTYKHFREKLLWEKEKSLLPATQPIVEEIMQAERNKKKAQVLEEEIFGIEDTIRELNKEIEGRKRMIKEYRRTFRVSERQSNVLFIRKCPSTDCRGFLNSQWRCGICERWTCPQCNEIKGMIRDDPEHICKEENLETARLLRMDTKHCPTCATPIFKIEGCDQMFCTQCQTSFSWRTGRIETGQIHNPHYFEYMRKHRREIDRNPNDILCGRELNENFILTLEDTLDDNLIEDDIVNHILTVCQRTSHIQRMELPRYANMGMQTNEDLRVAYLRNTISEEDFKKIIQRKEKDIQKKHEMYNILHMFVQCVTDILYRILHSTDKDEILVCVQEIHTLRMYANESMLTVSNVFKCRKFALSSDIILCNPDSTNLTIT